MSDGLTIRLTGDEAYDRKLRQFQALIDDLRPFWPLLVPIFIGWLGAQFATEGGWGGQTWAPLSPQYAQWKAAHYPGRSILIREGALRRAASEPRREASPRTFVLWIDDPKAVYHQEGNDRLPARPLIPDVLPPIAVREVEHAAAGYVSSLVRRLEL